jgi:hypothetical protein
MFAYHRLFAVGKHSNKGNESLLSTSSYYFTVYSSPVMCVVRKMSHISWSVMEKLIPSDDASGSKKNYIYYYYYYRGFQTYERVAFQISVRKSFARFSKPDPG